MNRLTLHAPDDPGPFDRVVIRIDGRPLLELVADAEAPHAAAVNAARRAAGPPQSEWEPLVAAGYGYPTVDMMRHPLAAALLGRVAPHSWLELTPGELELLICDCGDAGCGALVMRLDVQDEVVVWSGFRRPQREWALDLGPLRFDRGAYIAALALYADGDEARG